MEMYTWNVTHNRSGRGSLDWPGKWESSSHQGMGGRWARARLKASGMQVAFSLVLQLKAVHPEAWKLGCGL